MGKRMLCIFCHPHVVQYYKTQRSSPLWKKTHYRQVQRERLSGELTDVHLSPFSRSTTWNHYRCGDHHSAYNQDKGRWIFTLGLPDYPQFLHFIQSSPEFIIMAWRDSPVRKPEGFVIYKADSVDKIWCLTTVHFVFWKNRFILHNDPQQIVFPLGGNFARREIQILQPHVGQDMWNLFLQPRRRWWALCELHAGLDADCFRQVLHRRASGHICNFSISSSISILCGTAPSPLLFEEDSIDNSWGQILSWASLAGNVMFRALAESFTCDISNLIALLPRIIS